MSLCSTLHILLISVCTITSYPSIFRRISICHHCNIFIIPSFFVAKAAHTLSDIPSNYSPPWDVHLELMISVILYLYGVIIPLKLFPVQESNRFQRKTWDECIGRSEFSIFNHRKDEVKITSRKL